MKNPEDLLPHPYALIQFPLGPESDDSELVGSIQELGVTRPLTITGARCASPSGTVLNGNRRRRAAVAAGATRVPVRVLDDLTQSDEERIVLSENLADQQGRRLSESQRAKLERELSERLGKGQGHRSDINTSAAAGGSAAGDTREKVAAVVGSSRHAVDDRRVIFYSPASCDALKNAVDAGAITRTRAAALVREAERKPAVAATLKSVEPTLHQHHEVLTNASAWVEQQLRDVLNGRVVTKRKKTPRARTADLSLAECPTEVSLAGRKLRVELRDDRLHLEDLGDAEREREPGPFVWPEKAYLVAITRTNWVHAVHRAVALFPDDLRGDILIREPTLVPRQECSDCGGTRFSRDARQCIVCVSVQRGVPVVDLRAERTELLVEIAHSNSTVKTAITYWSSSRDAGLYFEPGDSPVVMIGHLSGITLGPKKDAYNRSIAYLCIATWGSLIWTMKTTHGVQSEAGAGPAPRQYFRRDGSKIGWRNLPDWTSFASTEPT